MTRARLQLAVGGAVVLGEEIAVVAGPQRFAARRPGDPVEGSPTRLVLLHPGPPDGPARGRMLDRMAAIRTISHTGLVAPLAAGQLDSETWVVEALPVAPTLADRLDSVGRLSVQETVRILRESARALSALHRAGLVHGAFTPAAIECGSGAILIHHLGHADQGASADDLRALGRIGWLALIGREPAEGDRAPRQVRDNVPEPLDGLLAALLDPDPAARLPTAEAVLDTLDWFPAREVSPLRTLIDGAGRGARLPRERRAALVLAAIGVAMLLVWVLTRQG